MIHKTVIVDDSKGPIYIGHNSCIGAFTILIGPLTIEDGVMIGTHCNIGAPAEHRNIPTNHDQNIRIGKDTVIRERTVIQRGILGGIGTNIGERAYVMGGCQISHDCTIEDDTTMASMAVLGGHCHLMKGAYMGIQSSAHPWVVIGSYALLGMGAVAVTSKAPGFKYVGVPARELIVNDVGIIKFDVSTSQWAEEDLRFSLLTKARGK